MLIFEQSYHVFNKSLEELICELNKKCFNVMNVTFLAITSFFGDF